MSGAVQGVLLARRLPVIEAFGGTLTGLDAAPAYNAQAVFTLNIDGTNSKSAIPSGSDTIGANWCLDTSASSSVWVRATLTSGTTPTIGTMGSWLLISTLPAWANTRATVGLTTSTISLEFAEDSAGTYIFATRQIILRAECT